MIDMRYAIGVDLGGTQVRAVRVDRDGQVYAFERADTAEESGPEGVVAQIAGLIAAVQGDVPADEVIGVGVGAPGPVDPFNDVVLGAPNLPGWDRVPLKALLHERTGFPVEIGNDANLAALGEWRFGGGRGCQHFIYVTISTGIGGGIIVDSKLLLGRKGIAAEPGHMTIETNGPPCGCGNWGCWEALASGTALARVATEAIELGRPSLIKELAGDEPISARHVAEAASRDDELALELMQREGELIGIGLINLLHLFAPDRIALGGGVSKSMALLEPHIRRTIDKRAMPPYRDTPIQLAQLGGRVGVMGAAALML
jgi:glucokinase